MRSKYLNNFINTNDGLVGSLTSGEEPEDDIWVLDWADWAGAYKILLRRQKQYRTTIEALKAQTLSLTDIIERTVRREPIPIAS